MKKLHELTIGEIFIFSSNGLKYGYDTIEGTKYKTCNRKKFKYIGNGQYIEQTFLHGRYIDNEFSEILNIFTHGRGCNSKLNDECVTVFSFGVKYFGDYFVGLEANKTFPVPVWGTIDNALKMTQNEAQTLCKPSMLCTECKVIQL